MNVSVKPPGEDATALAWAAAHVEARDPELLGRRCALGCFTSAMSRPRAADQRLHKDHEALFEGDPDAGTIPSFAVTTMVPPVPLDERAR